MVSLSLVCFGCRTVPVNVQSLTDSVTCHAFFATNTGITWHQDAQKHHSCDTGFSVHTWWYLGLVTEGVWCSVSSSNKVSWWRWVRCANVMVSHTIGVTTAAKWGHTNSNEAMTVAQLVNDYYTKSLTFVQSDIKKYSNLHTWEDLDFSKCWVLLWLHCICCTYLTVL